MRTKMIDPVNNFQIPQEWISRAKIPPAELKARITSGRYVLLSDGSLLRRGYTTGTTAAAAAKGAVLSLKKDLSEISVPTPIGIHVTLPVRGSHGKAVAIKDAGDHASDVTNGIEIVAEAREYGTIVIKAGAGIGSKKGSSAINPSPMRQIEEAIREALVETGLKGAHVIISVPKGKEISKHTLNEKIGITGGISILGTTGFVEPWNEHLGETKEELIRDADKIVLTTGRLGMRFSHMLFPEHIVILIGSDISRGLKAAKDNSEVIICGLAGLILKWASPELLKGSGYLTVREMIDDDPGNPLIDRGLSEAVKASGKRVVLLNRDGTVLRDSGDTR
jgi:cobalt-precorrin-5B (C1)-methyltransferase